MATSKTKAANKKKLWMRVLCIVLCALLAGGTVASVLIMLLQ